MERALRHFVVVRKKAEFLHRMMMELAGDSVIWLHGDLSKCRFSESVVVPKGAAAYPHLAGFYTDLKGVVLQLAANAVEPVFKQILAAGLKKIIHVQIVRDGELLFGAYDNFDQDCVVTGPGVSSVLLESLKAEGLISSFEPG